MPTAEIIAIGTELLLGEIQDTNTRYLARTLRDAGVDIFRTMTVGDNAERIAQVIRESLSRADIIITTGGLGPTIDDPTRDAVALALNVSTEFRPDLWEQIQVRFQRFHRVATENNRRQAYIPQNAIPVENPVGTAPSFICETGGRVIISLPGVPREMEYLTQNAVMPFLRQQFNLTSTIQAFIIHVSGIGESQVDELVGDLEKNSNPTLGLAAHTGIIDVRITAKADTVEEANQLLEKMALEVKSRLGDSIYGYNEDTLEALIHNQVQKLNWQIAILECGIDGGLIQRLTNLSIPPNRVQILPDHLPADELLSRSKLFLKESGADIVLAVSLQHGEWQQNLTAYLVTPLNIEKHDRSYGGPASMGPTWCVNTSLDLLRRALHKHILHNE